MTDAPDARELLFTLLDAVEAMVRGKATVLPSLNEIAAARAYLAAAAVEPAPPREPTREMIRRGVINFNVDRSIENCVIAAWRSMWDQARTEAAVEPAQQPEAPQAATPDSAASPTGGEHGR